MITDQDVKKAVDRELKPIREMANNWHESVVNALAALKKLTGGSK